MENACNKQIIKIDIISEKTDFDTTDVHLNHLHSSVMRNQTKLVLNNRRNSQQQKKMLLPFQIG